MFINAQRREEGACSAGKVYYACNGFKGCCSQDVCSLGLNTCPGTDSSSSSSASITSTLTLAAVIPEATAATATSITAAAITSGPAVSMVSSASSASSTPVEGRSNSTNNTPMIAGVVCGIVAASILSVLLWFFWRRGRQRRSRNNSSAALLEKGGKESRQDSYYEGQRLQSDEQPYGDYHSRNASVTEQAPRISMDIGVQHPEMDAPLPEDPEKATISPPPVSSHPAYHPLPGSSPEMPAFLSATPGTPLTPTTPMTPVHSQQQKSHPAYHVHKLSNHPAFRPTPSPRPSPRPSPKSQPIASPREQPPLWQHPAFKPNDMRQVKEIDSKPIIPRNELDGFSFFNQTPAPAARQFQRPVIVNVQKPPKPRTRKQRSASTLLSKPSELPAEVPKSFSYSSISQSHSSPNMKSHYKNQESQSTNISRDGSHKTGLSTYSIPIGLGVDSNGDSPIIKNALEDLPSQQSSPQIRQLTPPRIATPPPPMKSNMNEREDHVMSWASYGAGNLSGIGPRSNSNSSSRSQRQREIEQGHLINKAEEFETLYGVGAREAAFGDMGLAGPRNTWVETPETPLSAVYGRESWVERESWCRR
ncbi:hypothetical protein B0J14DRAFT_596786 [Halenospora varia]|nr:hypothetical protein B0J14DRAFT_596786 [Halenospora varia]